MKINPDSKFLITKASGEIANFLSDKLSRLLKNCSDNF